MSNIFHEALKLIAGIICCHPPNSLRFKGVTTVGIPYKNTMEKRYMYVCEECGAELITETPRNCGGCKHLYLDNIGAVHCDREPYDGSCYNNEYILYEMYET